ncbi:MAG: hypothetical protein ACLRJC_13620, partial [Emergencia timonensis]
TISDEIRKERTMRHHKLFTVIYVVVVAVMLVPAFLQFANKPALVLGWPAFFMWLIAWTIIGVIAMIINYRMDCKADAERQRRRKS